MKILRRLASLILILVAGCATHDFIDPSDSQKHCIRNFKTEGTLLSGKKFTTEAPIASKSLTRIIDQIVQRMPAIGFQAERVDTKNGIIHGVHLKTLELGRDRAAKLTVKVKVAGANPNIALSLELRPAQVSFEGDIQYEFCEIISASEIESLDY